MPGTTLVPGIHADGIQVITFRLTIVMQGECSVANSLGQC